MPIAELSYAGSCAVWERPPAVGRAKRAPGPRKPIVRIYKANAGPWWLTHNQEAMTPDELNRRLKQERVVPVAAGEWSELARHFDEVERHDTFVAGDLVIVRGEVGLLAVEQPCREERVLRRFSSREEANRFVQRRLDQYERMWDGCGCKIDYYKDE